MAAGQQTPIRLIYIAGAGRSGSTLLASVLGHHAELVSVGELSQLHRRGWRLREPCSCGQPGPECPYWSEIAREWHACCAGSDLDRYVELQQRFERLRAWPRLAWEGRFPSTRLRAYLEQTRGLIDAVAAVSGRRTIVDSSKNPTRAQALSLLPDVQLFYIHLVRDVRAVAWSHAKAYRKDVAAGVQRDMPPKPAWESAVRWTAANLIAQRVARHCPGRTLRIRYEDLVADPCRELDRIGAFVGLDFSPIGRALRDGAELPIQHQIAGNRLRMQGAVRLRPDWEWLDHLPERDRRMCWRIGGRIARRYGYVPDPDSAPRMASDETPAPRHSRNSDAPHVGRDACLPGGALS